MKKVFYLRYVLTSGYFNHWRVCAFTVCIDRLGSKIEQLVDPIQRVIGCDCGYLIIIKPAPAHSILRYFMPDRNRARAIFPGQSQKSNFNARCVVLWCLWFHDAKSYLFTIRLECR